MPDEELIGVWPCNHLCFSYVDITPELTELDYRLDIGYTIYDGEGRKYQELSRIRVTHSVSEGLGFFGLRLRKPSMPPDFMILSTWRFLISYSESS